MRSKQTPSPTALVVKPGAEPSAEVVDRLASLGTVRPIPGTKEVVLEVAGAAGSARELWRRVLDAVDRIRWAAPWWSTRPAPPTFRPARSRCVSAGRRAPAS